jgi:hypothetical protein
MQRNSKSCNAIVFHQCLGNEHIVKNFLCTKCRLQDKAHLKKEEEKGFVNSTMLQFFASFSDRIPGTYPYRKENSENFLPCFRRI